MAETETNPAGGCQRCFGDGYPECRCDFDALHPNGHASYAETELQAEVEALRTELAGVRKLLARPVTAPSGTVLSLHALRRSNVARQAEWDSAGVIDLSYRGNELAGEVGEACNVIKKLERERLGIRGSRDTVEHLAEELADVVICVDLIAMATGIDLSAAVVAKFNATSEKVGLETRLQLGAAVPAMHLPAQMTELRQRLEKLRERAHDEDQQGDVNDMRFADIERALDTILHLVPVQHDDQQGGKAVTP